MKKLLTLLCALTAVFAVCAFAGCGNDDRQPEGKIEHGYSVCYAFTASSDEMTITETSTMKDYMDALKGAGKLTFDGSDSEYGFYVTSVLGISSVYVSSTENSYAGYDWYVYTTVTTVDGVLYSTDESFDFNGVTLYKSSYGVSGLPVIEGESYALVFEYAETTW